MERSEFIKNIGKGVLLVCAGGCLGSCSSGDDGAGTGTNTPPPSSGTTVSTNLSNLSSVGSQFTTQQVLFIKVAEGNTASSYIATEALCPHQGGQLVWKQNDGLIQCQLHFAEYEIDGDVIQGPQNSSGTTRKLKLYAVTVSGSTITATVS
jgi:cytochrome b6-f complex iron-sulfur subunit